MGTITGYIIMTVDKVNLSDVIMKTKDLNVKIKLNFAILSQ